MQASTCPRLVLVVCADFLSVLLYRSPDVAGLQALEVAPYHNMIFAKGPTL